MAKALFDKGQRVYAKPVGTWAVIEKVIPHWTKGVEEPLRVTYDVGLGREFTNSELVGEAQMNGADNTAEAHAIAGKWRLFRMKNRWQPAAGADTHPFPGTFPVILTDDKDWGGWRVPCAEYDRDPHRVEHQARLLVNSPGMLRVVRQLVKTAERPDAELPEELKKAAEYGARIMRHIYDQPDEDLLAAE